MSSLGSRLLWSLGFLLLLPVGMAACHSSTEPAPPPANPPAMSNAVAPSDPTGGTASATTSAMNNNAQSSPDEYRVTPADIQNLLAGEGGVDLRTVTSGTRTAAMRIIGVRPGSTAARLGSQNDDTIESINGVPAGSPGAMNTWTQMAMTEKRLVLRGTRAGQPRTSVLIIEGR